MAFAPACPNNGLVYAGQAFNVSVLAMNAAEGITQNYRYSAVAAQNFASDVTLSAVASAGGAVIAGAVGALNNTTVANSDFNNGSNAAGTSTPAFTFAAAATAPTDVFIRAIESAGDGVASSLHEGGLKVVSGRIRISNAYGSEILPLTMMANAQYCASIAAGACVWNMNGNDSVTTFNTAANIVPVITNGPLALANVAVTNGVVVLANGSAVLNLAAPGVPGGVSIGLNAPTFLGSVAGQATFGVYRGGNQFIYQREAY
ncbi:MAG: hypothetical protein PHH36_13690, partial [Sideroxydans sp.]|nr:hypothetical protein [Sideroxydans sp.]